jgi:hypothetical protein
MQQRLVARAADIGKHWPELPVSRKRAVLAALIKRIEVKVWEAQASKIPCIFPASREFGSGDGFARDCPSSAESCANPTSSERGGAGPRRAPKGARKNRKQVASYRRMLVGDPPAQRFSRQRRHQAGSMTNPLEPRS